MNHADEMLGDVTDLVGIYDWNEQVVEVPMATLISDGTADSPAYRSMSDILTDGWEPYAIDPIGGGVYHLFKMKIDYYPGAYQGPVQK